MSLVLADVQPTENPKITEITVLEEFEGKTNGEVIQALFPYIEVSNYGVVVRVKGLDCDKGALEPYRYFWAEWWNAPYKTESEDKE